MQVTGRARGGEERAKRLSPEQRSAIAKRAAWTRWEEVPEVICGSPDRPLRIADVEIACYVLEGGTRVLSQAGFLEAMGRHPKASVKPQDAESGDLPIPPLLQGKTIRPYISEDVLHQRRRQPRRSSAA